MTRLMTAIEKFASVFANNDQNMGRVLFLEQPRKVELPKKLVFSEDLNTFYSYLDLDDSPTIGGDFYLEIITLDKIEQFHVGWRWIRSKSGTVEENPEWKNEWTIFAERSGDALIADTSKAETPVFGSIQNNIFMVSDSLAEFFETLSECMVIEEKQFDFNTRLDDMSFKPDFIKCISEFVSNKLSKDNSEGFMRFFFD